MEHVTLSGKTETIFVAPGLGDIVKKVVSEAAAAGVHVEVREGASLKRKTKKVILREGMEECRKIMADVNLTAKEKAAAVKAKVEGFVEDLIEVDSKLPEVRAWWKRRDAIENKYIPKRGITFCCPQCGDYWPKRPPELCAVDSEFDAIRARKVEELVRKILAGKAA